MLNKILKITTKEKIRNPKHLEFTNYRYLQSSAHLGGLVTFSLPHGKVSTVAPQKHLTSTVRGQG